MRSSVHIAPSGTPLAEVAELDGAGIRRMYRAHRIAAGTTAREPPGHVPPTVVSSPSTRPPDLEYALDDAELAATAVRSLIARSLEASS